MIYARDSGTFTIPGPGTTLDKHFQPVDDSTQVVVTGCSLQPVSTSEMVSNTDLTVSDSKLLIPAEQMPTGVTTQSTFTPSGSTQPFQVLGTPRSWTDRRGIPHHITIYLREARATSGS